VRVAPLDHAVEIEHEVGAPDDAVHGRPLKLGAATLVKPHNVTSTAPAHGGRCGANSISRVHSRDRRRPLCAPSRHTGHGTSAVVQWAIPCRIAERFSRAPGRGRLAVEQDGVARRTAATARKRKRRRNCSHRIGKERSSDDGKRFEQQVDRKAYQQA
jgi:hypothetical protein